MTRRPEMSCYDPRDPAPGTDPQNPPQGFWTASQILACLVAALVSAALVVGLAALVWEWVG